MWDIFYSPVDRKKDAADFARNSGCRPERGYHTLADINEADYDAHINAMSIFPNAFTV